MQKIGKIEKYLCSTIFSYQKHMSLWQGAHAPPSPSPFGKILKSWIFCIETCIQMTFFLILFNLLFVAYQLLNLATFSGPPLKLVSHFLVHCNSSANSMHV